MGLLQWAPIAHHALRPVTHPHATMEAIRAYALVNVFVAHAADGDLADEELDVIRRNVHRLGRGLAFPAKDIEAALHQAMETYWQLLSLGESEVVARFRTETRTLALTFQRDPRLVHAIREDLMEVAGADGEVLAMETFLIDAMAKRWKEAQA